VGADVRNCAADSKAIGFHPDTVMRLSQMSWQARGFCDGQLRRNVR